MNELFVIYQLGVLLIVILGIAHAVRGIGKVPFMGHSKYSDSVFNRIGAAAGVAAIWPFFLIYLLFRGKGK